MRFIIKMVFTVGMLTAALLIGTGALAMPGASATIIYPTNLSRVPNVSNSHYVHFHHKWHSFR